MEAVASSIEFQMSLLLFLALAGYLIAARIHQSAVVGEILVGIAVGPGLLGLVTATPFVQSLAHLGAVFLLFVIGFEFRLSDLLSLRNMAIALVGVIVPWAGGFLLMTLLGYQFAPSILIGTALTATSIAITAQVLTELHCISSPAGTAIIGAAVIDDVLGLVALSITDELLAGGVSLSGIAWVLIQATLFIVAAGLAGRYVLIPLLYRVDQSSIAVRYTELVFIISLAVAFLYALVAEAAGLSPIIGAFIAGIYCGQVRSQNSRDLHDGAEYLRIIFASIFFVSLGVLADIRELTVPVLELLLLLTLVAVITKVAGCGLPALLCGLSGKEALIVGVGMVPRGEVAMIVALIGLQQQIIGQDLFIVVILMSLITTLVTPPIFQRCLGRTGEILGQV